MASEEEEFTNPKKDIRATARAKEYKKVMDDASKTIGKINQKIETLNAAGKLLTTTFGPFADVLKLASERTTVFSKQLGLSDSEATKLSGRLSKAADFSGNLATNSTRASKALGILNKGLGTGTTLFEKQAVAASRFATTLGLSEKSQQNLAFTSKQQGKSIEDLVKSQVGAVKAVESEFGTRLDITNAIKEATEITGQVRAQLAGNLDALVRTVAVTKQFGFELNGIVNSSKSLLDFQSSIESELQAELLIGRQLNLEQARLFALTGDYAGLTEEIAKNVGGFYEFSKLNVLQQDAIAKSVGMTTDSLSDALFKEASIVELKEQARAEGDEETLKMLERMTMQENLNLLTEKFLSVVVTIGTALEPILNNTFVLGGILAGLAAMKFTSFIASLAPLVSMLLTASGAAVTLSSALTGGAIALGIVAALAIVGGAITAYASNAQKRAIGGPINAGQPYMVGERGPELIVPTNSGMVVSNNQLSSGGGRGRSDSEIVSLATKAAARSISVDFNTPRFNSINSLDAVFA